MVLVDRDDDECDILKERLEAIAKNAGMTTRSSAKNGHYLMVNRIAVRELENWYLGDWTAVRQAFVKVRGDRPASYRKNPDYAGKKTSDQFGRVLVTAGVGVASKPERARRAGPRMVAGRNTSASFQAFVSAFVELAAQ